MKIIYLSLAMLLLAYPVVYAYVPTFVKFSPDTKEITISVDETRTIPVFLANNNEIADNVTLSISKVFWAKFRDGSSQMLVEVPPESTATIPVKIKGVLQGTHSLKVEAKSLKTGLASEDTLRVRVIYKKEGFFKQSPGLGWASFLLIVFIAIVARKGKICSSKRL